MFLHVDLDAFYSSVEQLDNPEYRGRPVIVGGLPSDARSVVSTCSYEARKFGVHSAMPIAKAYRLCPGGIFLRGRMKRYLDKSAEVMAVFDEFSPDVQQMSIDEAFVDISGTERLFGSPQNTARLLKTAVRERTGLTISVGLASNKYVAKIASGMSKPDGLFIVPKGEEEKFMRALPLAKLWGAGKKTQDKLLSAGFASTEDIFNAPLEMLTSILGAAAGAFLYRAVRGQAAETFDSESKSHSLSAERTYKEDITNKFVIETALLELCQTVMFRLLHHNQKGKTVHLKIRYGDFTTVNVQETGQSDVSSVDNLFERVISLFEKKYKAGNGIRLLGVGIQNITGDSSATQGQLFDFGEKKKQQVEQAILSLQKKDSTVNVKKARLFKKLTVFIISVLLCAIHGGANAQEQSGRIDAESASNLIVIPLPTLPTEDPKTLFSYTVDNNNIEFLAEGFWQMQLEGKTGFTFAEDKSAVSTFTPPVFSQKVDLSLWFMLNRRWYFEGSFADGFEKNTVAAGYNGTGVVKSARISNRGIIFPSTYPADSLSRGISGGDNQAPGFSISLSGEKWKSNAAVRYDYLLPREKTWYGSNEVSYTDLHASSWSRGKFFVLPSRESAALVERVFVENASGSARDSDGRRFRELLPSEYLLIPSQALLVLAKEAVTTDINSQQRVLLRVAVTFSDNRTRADNDMGTFTAASASGGDFLKQTRDFFLSSTSNPSDIINYAYNYKSSINAENALVLQSPAGFSPFASGWKYASYASNAGNIRVIAPSTETAMQQYDAVISSDIAAITADDFFNSRAAYIDALNPGAASNSPLDPAARFPFADSFPQVYLLPQPAFDSKTNDAPVIRIESYTPVSRFSIGTSAVNVRVSKNGAVDTGALYDSETGIITLSSVPAQFDRIHITWYEENQAADFGSLAAGIGFSYTPFSALELSTSLTSRWTIAPDHKFADSNAPSPGFVTLAFGADWQPLSPNGRGTQNAGTGHSLIIKNAAGVSYETDNTTGFFRVLGMDDSVPSTVYLAESAAHNNNIVPILNPRSGQQSARASLVEANRGALRGTTQKDSGISGNAVLLDYDFSGVLGASSINPAWAAAVVDLGQSATGIASARRFELALKIPAPLSSNQAVYLQLGVEASDNPAIEDGAGVPTWRIDSGLPDAAVLGAMNVSRTDWQSVTLILSDEDKARLSRYTGARIIVTGLSSDSGEILVGPFEITHGAFDARHDQSMTVSLRQTIDNASGKAERFTKEKSNYVQEVSWHTGSPAPSDTKITLTRYIAALDLSQHKKLNVLIKAPRTSNALPLPLTVILDREENGDSRQAFRLEISGQQFSGGWQLVSADFFQNKVFVDGNEISSNEYALSKNTGIVPVRVQIIIDTANFPNGVLLLDEIHFEESINRFVFEDRAEISWKYAGTVLGAGKNNFSLISNPALNITGLGALSASEVTNAGSAAGFFDASVTLAGIQFSFDTAANSSRSTIGDSGHAVKTIGPENPLFLWLSFSEQFRYGESALTLSKENSAGFAIPSSNAFSLNASARASSSRSNITQHITGSLKTELPVARVRYALETRFSVNQNVSAAPRGADAQDDPSYGDSYLSLTHTQFSTGRAEASRRANELAVTQTLMFPAAQFSPRVEFAAQGKYALGAQILFVDTQTLSFVFPFTVNRQRFTLTWTKKGGSSRDARQGGDYSRDIHDAYAALAEHPWFFYTPPFYDLFSEQLVDDVKNSEHDSAQAKTNGVASSQYSTVYQAAWARPFSGMMSDFFIPSSALFSAGRDVSAAANISDVYQLKAQAGWTAMNCFGALSAAPLFSWYEQDEFISSLSVTAKIPAGAPDSNSAARNTIATTGYAQSTFYVKDDNSLKAALDITLTALNTWHGSVSAAWNRASNAAPYKALFSIFSPSIVRESIKLTRSDTISFTIHAVPSATLNSAQLTESDFRFAFAYNHREEIALIKYVSLFIFAGGAWNYDTRIKITLFEIPAGLGGKIVF